jgi:hypothetical protein
MSEHVFEVEEADALIPRLEFLIGRLQAGARRLREEVNAVATEQGVPAADLTMPRILQLRPPVHALVEEINRRVREIEELGGLLKDLELGLVDFPAEIGGERVCLCWQYGEKVVGFWHRPGDGFAGRRPLKRRAVRRYLQ